MSNRIEETGKPCHQNVQVIDLYGLGMQHLYKPGKCCGGENGVSWRGKTLAFSDGAGATEHSNLPLRMIRTL